MWSLPAALDGRNASILGVGHFTVPPDGVEAHDDTASANGNAGEPSSSIRTIVVPHGIAAVPRRSPIKARKRTAWNPAAAPRVVECGGTREWFTDRVFVESQATRLPAFCSISAIVQVALVILVVLLLAAWAAPPDLPPHKFTNVSLRMPAFMPVLSATVAPPRASESAERAALVAPPPPAPARTLEARAAAPVETPSGIEAEPATVDDAPIEAVVAGAEVGGAVGGVAGGTGRELGVEPAQPPAATGPFRVGEGIDRPRKTRHVKPVYPPQAMAARVGGNVLIEVTIGIDGKVHDARVINSIPVLDQAALDAVRQWEFEPSRVNGVAVAVTMVIVVMFALL
jgi:protein TonB